MEPRKEVVLMEAAPMRLPGNNSINASGDKECLCSLTPLTHDH